MRAFAILVLALCAGCGSTSTYHVITGPAAAPLQGDPQVFMPNARLPSNYVEVAIVQAIGRGNNADVEHVFEGLRAEAATLGCSAIVATHVDQGTNLTSGTGVAVRWVAGPPPAMGALRGSSSSPWTPAATVVAPWATPGR